MGDVAMDPSIRIHHNWKETGVKSQKNGGCTGERGAYSAAGTAATAAVEEKDSREMETNRARRTQRGPNGKWAGDE